MYTYSSASLLRMSSCIFGEQGKRNHESARAAKPNIPDLSLCALEKNHVYICARVRHDMDELTICSRVPARDM